MFEHCLTDAGQRLWINQKHKNCLDTLNSRAAVTAHVDCAKSNTGCALFFEFSTNSLGSGEITARIQQGSFEQNVIAHLYRKNNSLMTWEV
jgi:hypothetical protein